MKKWISLICMLILLCVTVAQADTYYVHTENGKALTLRSVEDNSILLTIPYGTPVETDDLLSNDDIAYIHYNNKAGYVSWDDLAPLSVGEVAPAATAAPAAPVTQPAQPVSSVPEPAGALSIETIGAYIQYSQGGEQMTFVSGDPLPKVIVSADTRPAYWVINGIRYDFEFEIPRAFTLENVTEPLVIEAVQSGRAAQTQLTMEEIQAARTGETLLVKAINAKLCHIKASGYGAGGWMDQFDFTLDFKNRATEQMEQGGQVTVRCRANVPEGRRISYWKFDEMKIDFNTDVTQFIVHTLNESKIYEPVLGEYRATAKPTAKPTATPTPKPTATPTPVVKYRVDCHQCTFSGGGYTNATSGTVPAGTVLTFKGNMGMTSGNKWWVNGSHLTTVDANTITRTINQDTYVEWQVIIN